MSLAVKPLSPALGAEIVGLDLREELSAQTVAEIIAACDNYGAAMVFTGLRLFHH